MIIFRKSIISGKVAAMDLEITAAQVKAYEDGKLLQDAFPNLNDEEREFYMTGITPDEWNATFKDE